MSLELCVRVRERSIVGRRTCLMRASMRKSEQAELCLKVAAIIPAVTAIPATCNVESSPWTHFVTGGRLMPVSICCSVGQAVEPVVSCPASEGVQGGVVSGAHTARELRPHARDCEERGCGVLVPTSAAT